VLCNAVKSYGTGLGRKYLGQVLDWSKDLLVFKSILAHPRLVGYHMEHFPFVIAQDEVAEGGRFPISRVAL
jgi:hypothetical protein